MTFNETDPLKKFFKMGYKIPDDYFIELENILVPLAFQSFERFGVAVAKFIAHEFGAKVTILHNGKRDPERFIKEFESLKIPVEVIITKRLDTAKAILEEAVKDNYQLMIMPSRRRLKWIDRFLLNSVSAKVIPKVNYDVLQAYPQKGRLPGEEEEIPSFEKIGILLPRTQRDPKLLFWANSLLIGKKGELHAYHIADLPNLTPLRGALEADVIVKEKEQFEILVKGYEAIFSTRIIPHFIVSHNVGKAAAAVLNRDKPDLAIMGHSKREGRFGLKRTLTDYVLDTARIPMLIHHQH